MRTATRDIAAGHAREATFMLLVASAVGVLWVHAWTLSINTRSDYIPSEPPPRLAVDGRHQVPDLAAVDAGN